MQKPSGEAQNKTFKWPWLVGVAVVVGIALAIVWMSLAVKKIERERDGNTPLPSSAPVH